MNPVVFLVLLLVHVAQPAPATYSSYGVVIDAGSTGSRVRIYGWNAAKDSDLPDYQEVFKQKKSPGISDYAEKTNKLGEYMQPLIDVAKENIPESKHAYTPIYLMATAGKNTATVPQSISYIFTKLLIMIILWLLELNFYSLAMFFFRVCFIESFAVELSGRKYFTVGLDLGRYILV
jgi:hypothetical protein